MAIDYIPARKRVINVGVMELSRRTGLNPVTVSRRLRDGMTPEEVIATPRRVGDKNMRSKYAPPLEPKPKRKTTGKGKQATEKPSEQPVKRKRGEHISIPVEITRDLEQESFIQAQRREKIAQANERELKYKQQMGWLIPDVQVRAWYSKAIISGRDALLRMPGELRDRLAAETDPGKCEEMVLKEVERVLEMLAKYDQPVEQPAGREEGVT